jgi:hypothetical protein
MLTKKLPELKDEINQIRHEYPRLQEDSAFVLWFLRSQLTDSEDNIKAALTGEAGDKGIDAIYIDHQNKVAHVVQGKFRQIPGQISEKRSDVLDLANKALIPWTTKEQQTHFYSKLSSRSKQLFHELASNVHDNNYSLQLYYVTTGRCSKTIRNEAISKAKAAECDTEFFIYDWENIEQFYIDYIEGIAPAIPMLALRINPNGRIQNEGTIYRFDPQTAMESWVFSMSAQDAGDMYEKAGLRLFARNIRGYLGETEINEAIKDTLVNEPHNFWYYNNGITIVCDSARQEKQKGQELLRLERPQVINGQQTIRTLTQTKSESASVLVKVIKIPRDNQSDDDYSELIRKIVRATNWQNAIKNSDLISNDPVQVYLERELRKCKYLYLRKRQSRQEARSCYGGSVYSVITKEELAQAIAACIFDPAIVRRGKEGLFEDEYYRSIFSSRDPSYYLARYWLMRRIQSNAQGKPARAYAKWLVLNFTWQLVSKYLSNHDQELRFRQVCEYKDENILSSLDKIIDGIFKAVNSFYNTKKGTGEEKKDESTFFQLTKLDELFGKYWKRYEKERRIKIEKQINKFGSALTSSSKI